MRRISFGAWLLLVAVAAAIVAIRFGRALGVIGIVVAVVLIGVSVVLLRGMIEATRKRSADQDRWRAPTKNVTPHEAALPPGEGYSPDPAAARPPSVIVIDPPDPSERLAAKLQALDDLRADGLVSDDEYEAKRAQLIADF